MSELMRPLLLLSNRPWNIKLSERLSADLGRKIQFISKPNELIVRTVKDLDPEWIFVPHWSHIIPDVIWKVWPTVIFHMTDLPYGRGGSPLQNLIQRGHSMTKISALRCLAELDAGPIYDQEELSLEGSAEEIFLRADHVIESMIKRHVQNQLDPKPQKGKPVYFKRRSPEQSNLATCSAGDLSTWYDHIRMLDADGYPHAYLQVGDLRLEFRRSSLRTDGIYCDVRISSNTKTPLD